MWAGQRVGDKSEPASTLSDRSLVDSQAEMGHGTTRSLERVLASCGLLTSVELDFLRVWLPGRLPVRHPQGTEVEPLPSPQVIEARAVAVSAFQLRTFHPSSHASPARQREIGARLALRGDMEPA